MHTIKTIIKCILCGVYYLDNRKYKMLRCIIWLRDNEYKARIELWILAAILWSIFIVIFNMI
jgi:hypothetical protein